MNNRINISIISGPNLNLLGTRETDKYGHIKLTDIVTSLNKIARNLGVSLQHFQSNSEYKLINFIHENSYVDFIIINPAALAHTSISLRDAILAVNVPFFEVHFSNIYSRESFRHFSYLSDIAIGVICGLGSNGYYFALNAAIQYLKESKSI